MASVVDAINIVGGNVVLGEAQGFDMDDQELANANNLEEMVQLPDLAKAKAFRDRSLLKDWLPDGSIKAYPVCSTKPGVLGAYGVGLELYFLLLQYLMLVFGAVSLVSIWPLLENYSGDGLQSGEVNYFYDSFTLGNQHSIDFYDPSLTVADADDELDTIAENQIRVVAADSVYSLLFLASIVVYMVVSKRVVRRTFKENVTAGDYAIQVKGIPADFNDTAQVLEHFQQFGPVAEVSLARKYNNLLDDYVRRAELSFKIGFERKKPQPSSKKIAKLQRKIDAFDRKIGEHPSARLPHAELPVDRAFVIFSNLADRRNCMKQYKKYSGFSKKLRKQPTHLRLAGVHPLTVREATEPSNIHWENLEVTHRARLVRRAIAYVVTTVVFLASIAVIFYLKTIQDDLPTEEECAEAGVTDLPLEEAEAEYTSDTEVFCYCMHESFTDLLNDEALNEFCEEYIAKKAQATTLRLLGSVGVLVINFVLKLLLKKLSVFERMSTKTQEQLKIMNKVFVAMFINTAFITLVVNANFDDTVVTNYLPKFVFNGEFADFTRSWYTKVGATLTLTMLISVGSPHLVNLCLLYPLGVLKRRCCWRRYKTQHELNAAFMGQEFDLATKVSQVLNVLFTCFLYSAGMPLLNVCCFVTLLLLYWSDKFLVLRHYNRPPYYSHRINDQVVSLLPLCVALHCMFALYMYGSDAIFPTGFHDDDGSVVADSESVVDRVRRTSGWLMLSLTVLSLALYIWQVPLGAWVDKKFKLNKVYDQTKKGQGTYQEELAQIKENGIHSYNILENKVYRPLILSLNAASEQLKNESLHVEDVSSMPN